MPSFDLYPTLRLAHIALVASSGALFAARGLALLAGARWSQQMPVRVGSVVIDTALLLAGAALAWILRLNPLSVPWLGTKLALLVLYVLLGTLALKHARSTPARVGWLLAAWACFGFMVSVALAHDPRGVLIFMQG